MNFKYFSILVLLLAILSTSSYEVYGQDKGLKGGLEAQALAQLAGTAPFRLGLGHSFGLWGELPITERSAVRLTTSLRRMNGLQLSTNAFSNEYLPREFRRNISTTMLNSLQYVDLSLSWRYTSADSPWSVGLGIHGSFLHTWRGARQASTWIHGERIHYWSSSLTGSYGIGGGSNARPLQMEVEPLDRKLFQSLDVGMQLHLSYRLSRGLDLQCSYLQGFRNLIEPELFGQPTEFFASSLALGIAARLF